MRIFDEGRPEIVVTVEEEIDDHSIDADIHHDEIHILNSHSDVEGTPTDTQVLTYENASGKWKPQDSGAGVTDHGALTGLGDDDHTQYHNNTRGDARYYQQSQVDTALGNKTDKVGGATVGNFAGLDGSGNLTDSGSKSSDFENAGAVSTHESTHDHTKLHEHLNKALLDTYTQTEVDLADAVSKKHSQGTDQYLDQGGANQVVVADAKDAVDKKHDHPNKSEIDLVSNGLHDAIVSGNPHAVTKSEVGLGDVENLKVNLSAASAPTVNDDNTSGYAVGSKWIDTTNDKGYVCVDASTGAAIWIETTQTAATLGEQWLHSYVPNTPSIVTRLFGNSANGFQPNNDVRLLKLSVQFYSEHPAQSKLRVRVFRYDAGATTDREILNITQTGVSVGYHRADDDTPDTNYYDVDVSAGDTVWVEIDDGAGGSASRIREITVNIRYQSLA